MQRQNRQARFPILNEMWVGGIILLMVLLVGVISVPQAACAETQHNYIWAVSANGDDYNITPYDIDVDKNRNSYIAGEFRGCFQFGTVTLDSQDHSDLFVAKLNADGEWIWANHFKASSGISNRAKAIAVDDQGNSYVTGSFYGDIEFGDITLTGDGSDPYSFIAKLDGNGNWIWAKRAGAGHAWDIAVDSQNNIYVTGTCGKTDDFGTGVFPTDNKSNVFVAKLDSDGNWLWVKYGGGAMYNNYGAAIAIGLNDMIHVAGYFQGDTANFGSITVSENAGFFVACLNDEGRWLWVEPFNIIGGGIWSIKTDREGNCFVAGDFRSITFDDGTYYYCNAYTDAFIAKFNPRGKQVGFIQSGTDGEPGRGGNMAFGIALDKEGNPYVTGQHEGKIKFGEATLENAGGFLAKWNLEENVWEWAKPAGGSARAIAGDTQDNFYMVGQFKGSALFDSISLENRLYDYARNVFVAKVGILDGTGDVPLGFPYFGYSKWDSEPAVAPTHNFKIKFNLPLNPAVAESGSKAVYVLAADNEPVPATLVFTGMNRDTVQVMQSSPYTSGGTYYLYIDADKIYSSPATGDKKLADTIVMKFTVQ